MDMSEIVDSSTSLALWEHFHTSYKMIIRELFFAR